MSANYVFRELEERQIRLLDLDPGQPGSPLHGGLRHLSIDNASAYEALSYTWGASTTSSVLSCDGASIHLTLNLQQALSRLRKVDKARTLWVDQICINQDDLVERGQQVSLMGEIYRNAQVVDIWLGEEDEETELAVASIPDLLGAFPRVDEEGGTNDEVPDVVRNLGILYIRSGRWVAFRKIFERPYFRRMWIVQEVALGSNSLVQCGSHTIHWNDLAKASLCMNLDVERQVEAQRAVQMIRRLQRELSSAVERPLSALLNQTYNLQCSDPRDKVYGILGLASDIKEGELVPDYNLSCQVLYSMATKFCICKDQSLVVLCSVQHPKALPGMPSWVPDWNAISEIGESIGFRSSEHYCAAGSTLPSPKFSNDSQVLYAKGKSIDAIRTLGSTMLESNQSKVEFEWEELARTVSPYHSGETYPTILWRAMIADDRTHGTESDLTRRQLYESHYNLVVRNRNIAETWRPIDEMSIVNSRSLAFQALIEATSFGRRIAITERGFLGLVPAGTQLGDYICIFQGGPVPFVLRQEPLSSYYTLLGECYLQGWMDGTRFASILDPVEEFAIR